MKSTILSLFIYTLWKIVIVNCDILDLQFKTSTVVTLPANRTVEAWVKGGFESISFIQYQLHTQFINISISTETSFSHATTKTGTSVGMIEVIKPGQSNVTWYIRVEGTENVTAVSYLDFFDQTDPLPGGCNEVFNLEIDPSIVLLPKFHRTDIWFQWANLAVRVGQKPLDCELQTVQNTLTYDVYVYFLAARDQSQDEFIKGVSKMLRAADIVENGMKIILESDGPSTKSLTSVTSESNQGAVYSVVVTRKDTGHQAAYTTALTYSCDYKLGECSTELMLAEIILPIILLCLGLFLLIFGHFFFKTSQFVFGFIFTSLLLYILMSTNHSIHDIVKLPVALSLAVLGGLAWVVFWWYCQFKIMSVFFVGLCSGYLCACMLFFTPFANLVWWQDEVNYSLGFVCAILIFTVGLMTFSNLLSIISCCIVGSFLFLLTFGIPLRSSLRHIFLNSLYHQTLESYLDVRVVFPCNSQDIALFTLWPALVILSFIWQWYREKIQRCQETTPLLPPQYEYDASSEDSGKQINSRSNDDETEDETARLLSKPHSGYGAVHS